MSAAMSGAAWTPVCPVDALIPERGAAALVAGEQIALFLLEDGTVRAVGHLDPFSGAYVMARGIVGSMGTGAEYRDTVASPMYKHVFDLTTGECLSEHDRGAGVRLPVWGVRIREGLVEVGEVVGGLAS